MSRAHGPPRIELSFELEQPFEACHQDSRVEQLGSELNGRRSGHSDARNLVRAVSSSAASSPSELAERGPPTSHQIAIEVFGGRLGRDVELSSQHVATHAILAQRFRMRAALRVQLHDHAMRRFVERLECDELVDAASAPSLSPFATHSSPSLFSASLSSLRNVMRSLAQPFVERGRARVEAVEQIAAIMRHCFLQRRARAGVQRTTERVQVAAHDRRIDADGFGVCEQRLVRIGGQ